MLDVNFYFVFFLVDDSKLNMFGSWTKRSICSTFVPQTPPPLLSSVDCRVDSGPNAQLKSQVKPVANDGSFKEAEPSSFPEPNKEVLVHLSIYIW